MPVYSDKFEERRNKVNKIIREKLKVEDYDLLMAIYSATNLEDYHKSPEKADMVNSTYFSGMDTKDLLKFFSKDKFNNKGNKYYEEIFQEIYNRQSKMNGYEPRYIVEVSGEAKGVNGFMRYGENLLNINAGMIERFKNEDMFSSSIDAKNTNTIGAHTLLTLLHETQHTFQSEGIMKFVLKEDTSNPQERAKNAFNVAKLCLVDHFNNSAKEENFLKYKELEVLVKNNYFFDFMEHDANMAPVKFLNKAVKENWISDKALLKAGQQRVINDIHINQSNSNEEINKCLKNRADAMEEIATKYLSAFKRYVKDGELKDEISQTLEAYLKPDKKGNSQFKKDLYDDFKMCLNFIESVNSNDGKEEYTK